LLFRFSLAAVIGVLFISCGGPEPAEDMPVAEEPISEVSETKILRTSDGPIRNIVLISVDTLRSDHMGIYGYDRNTTPEIDSFFEGGTVYENAYATTSRTPPSVVSFLSGLLPQHHDVRLFNTRVSSTLTTLPKLLREQGYECAAVVSNQVLSGDWMGLDTHFDHYDDEVTEKEPNRDQYERSAKPTTDAAIEWLESREYPDKPFFLWVHYMDPHGPYTPPTPKVKEFSHSTPKNIDVGLLPKYQRFPGITDGLEYVDLYDEEIANLDQEAGRLLDALAPITADGETLFAFTADHGETLMDHEQWFRHDYQVYEELVRVPLLVRGGGLAKTRFGGRVSNMDIVPTALELAELDVPDNLDGVSLLNPVNDRNIFIESGLSKTFWTGVIADSGKWLTVREMRQGGRNAFFRFDLVNDPRETKPIRYDPRATADAAPVAMFALYKTKPYVDAAPEEELSAEKEEELRSLGYVD